MSHSATTSKVGIKALRSVFAPLLVMLLAACILTVFITYQLSLHQLERDIHQIGAEHKPFIENMLWQFDTETIRYQLKGFVDMDSIRQVIVSDNSGTVITAKDASNSSSIPVTIISLTHTSPDGDIEEIGTLSIHASDKGIWALVRNRVFILVFAYLAVTSMISFLVLRQINQNIIKPILGIANILRSPPRNLSKLQIDLTRDSSVDDKDELDEFVDAIHQMRDQIVVTRGELEQGEMRLAQAAKLAGLGYCTFDPSMDKIIDCDQNYADFHKKSIQEMRSLHVGKDIVSVMLNKDDIPRALRSRERIITPRKDSQTYQLNYPDGQSRYIRQSFVARLDDNGQLFSIEAVAQDVTDDVAKQELLAQSQRIQAIGKLTGGVAHDFNNILAVIQGNIEILQAKSDDDSLQRHAETALKAVTQGGKLTQQLLSFARKQPLSPVVIDVLKLIRNSAALLQTSVGENIRLDIISENALWKTRADPVQLEAVILNLVVNARDAMNQNGCLTLRIGNAQLDQEYAEANTEVEAGNYVCISVEDSGTGMSPEVLRQAFEPFFTSKPVGKGTGLGLSMAFGFARQSGGHLVLDSEIGQGTTVKLYLPRVLSDTLPCTSETILEHNVGLTGLRVFLIEDNDDLRRIFSEQIVLLGCVVHSACDEVSALLLAEQVKNVDVILSDIVISGKLDGRTLSKRLQQRYPEARVVHMSGFTENLVVHNGRLDDGIVFLQKPFRLIDLARVLSEHE